MLNCTGYIAIGVKFLLAGSTNVINRLTIGNSRQTFSELTRTDCDARRAADFTNGITNRRPIGRTGLSRC